MGAWNSREIVGIATFTTVTSMTVMNSELTKTTPTTTSGLKRCRDLRQHRLAHLGSPLTRAASSHNPAQVASVCCSSGVRPSSHPFFLSPTDLKDGTEQPAEAGLPPSARHALVTSGLVRRA